MAQPYPQSPIVDMNMAIVVLIVNLLVPGIGTIVAGVMGEKPLIGRGVVQLLTSWLIVGWIWALVTSIQVLQNAKWKQSNPSPGPA